MNKTNIMENQQGYTLTQNQIQVLLTGLYGDGCIVKQKDSLSSYYVTSSVKRSLLELKYHLLGDLSSGSIKEVDNSSGYSNNSIFKFTSKRDPKIDEFFNQSTQDIIDNFTELGIALWFYDDGSLHKKNYFYNLCTHKYDKEYQEKYLIPLLNKFGIYPKLTIERKSDGREFYYLRIGKHDGAFEISEILSKYPVVGMEYKVWSSETSHEWRKLRAELKSKGQVMSKRGFSDEINRRLDKI